MDHSVDSRIADNKKQLSVKQSINNLIKNIYRYNLIEILKTQRLTEEFAVNYILNPRYQFTEEEELITFSDVLNYQTHFSKNKLLRLFLIGPNDTGGPNFGDYI